MTFCVGSPPARRSDRGCSIIGRQGTRRDDPAEVERLYGEALAAVEEDPERVPATWTAYRLVPDRVDVLQLRRASDGERIEYRRDNDRWTARDLWP